MLFIDDYSRWIVLETLLDKTEVLSAFKQYEKYMTTQRANASDGRVIIRFRADNGGEYRSDEFQRFLALLGVSSEPSPATHQASNDVSERWIQIII